MKRDVLAKSLLVVFFGLLFLTFLHLEGFLDLGEITGFAVFSVSDESSFGEGEYTNTEYSGDLNAVVLSSGNMEGVYESKVFDAGSEAGASWDSISWEDEYFSEELEDNKDSDLMQGNILLFHLNGNSNLIEDSSGENKDGIAEGDLTLMQEGKFNYSADFDGAEGYIWREDDRVLDDYTVSAWIKTSTAKTEGIFELSESAGGRNVLWLTSNGYPGIMYGDSLEYRLGSVNLADGEWHNIVGVYDGTSPAIYVDGGAISLGGEAVGGVANSVESLVVGKLNVHNDYYFDGQIDEFSLWNRSLSLSEVQEIYKRGALSLNLSARTCDDSLCSGEEFVFVDFDSPANLSLNENRYFQYKFDFYSDSESFTPELKNTQIAYELVNTAPSINLVQPQEGNTYGYNESINLKFSVSDENENIDSCWYVVGSGEENLISGCENTTFDVSGNGDYDLTIYVNDSLGEEVSDSVSFSVQVGAPTITLVSPVENYLDASNVVFTYVPEDVDLDSCVLWGNFEEGWSKNATDSAPISEEENSFSLNLEEGFYTWNIWCNDTQGESATNGNQTFYVDTSDPEVNISEPVGEKNSKSSIPLDFVVEDLTSLVCSYNLRWSTGGMVKENTTIENCSSTTFDASTDGDYVLNLFVEDSAGNLERVNSSFSVDSSVTTPVSNNPSSSGSGGGGSSYVTNKGKFEFDEISAVVSPGEKKNILFSIKNNDFRLKNKCKLTSENYSDWIDSSDVFNIGRGEIVEYSFVLKVPENVSSKKINLTLKCLEDSAEIPMNVVVLEEDFEIDFNSISFEEDRLKISYYVSSRNLAEKEIVFVVSDSGGEVARIVEALEVEGEETREVNIDVSGAEQGMLKVSILEGNRTFVEEDVIYSSKGITGFAVTDLLEGSYTIIGGIVLVFALVLVLVFRRILKSRKKKK